jgi:hypothetical protein
VPLFGLSSHINPVWEAVRLSDPQVHRAVHLVCVSDKLIEHGWHSLYDLITLRLQVARLEPELQGSALPEI